MQIFVSYSHDDKTARRQVVGVLEALGFDLWLDEKDLRVGTHIDDTIRARIAAADGFVALWSPAYIRQGSYTVVEWSYARDTLKKPRIAIILLEPVRPTDLAGPLSGLLMPSKALTRIEPQEITFHIASAVMEAGLRPPRGMPEQPRKSPDLASSMVHPPFDDLNALERHDIQAQCDRLERILAGNPNSPYHAINSALVWLHLGDTRLASQRARTALHEAPQNGEISYFVGLVAAAGEPLALASRDRASALWGLSTRGLELGYDRCMPDILRAAIAHECHERNGMRPPIGSDQLLRMASARPAVPSEMRRLMRVLSATAPSFVRRLA
jgi:hypothetical protein